MSETNGVKQVEYTDKNIITLEDLEHVRRRPGCISESWVTVRMDGNCLLRKCWIIRG